MTENLDVGPSQNPGDGRSHLACISNTGDDTIAPSAGAFASVRNQVFSHVRYIMVFHLPRKYFKFLAALFLFITPCYSLRGAVKALIFDCDGVLVDSEGMKFQAWEDVLKEKGITFFREYYQLLIGRTGLAILRQIEQDQKLSLSPKIVDEKNERYRDLQEKGVTPLQAMKPVIAWAQKKHEQGILFLGVASSPARREILCNLKSLEIDQIFDVIVSGKEDLGHYNDPAGVNKPQPYIYQEASRKLGLDPSDCLVLEDSEPGVCAAKTAGCIVIAVPNEWTVNQDFSMADLVIYPATSEKIIAQIEQFLE